MGMKDLKFNGLNKHWSIRFLILSFLLIGCISLVNVVCLIAIIKPRAHSQAIFDLIYLHHIWN